MPRTNPELYTLADEIRFINNIGSFHDQRTPSMGTVETLLRRYRKALQEREDISFDKSEALLLIDHRLKEIGQMRASALKKEFSGHFQAVRSSQL